MTDQNNPALSPLVRAMAIAVILFLINGSLLLFAPGIAIPRWPWEIPPFNARFLGAVYLAEAAAVAVLIRYNLWSPGRLALTIAVLFTIPATLGTLIHIDQMFWPGKRAALWFFLYAAYVVLPLLALWRHRSLPRPQPLALASAMAAAVLATGAILAAYGLVAFLAPVWSTAFWPWPVDGLHGRVYAGMFIAGGFGLVMVARGAGREEVLVMGMAALVLGAAAIAGLLLASSSTGRPIAYGPGTIAWLAGFAWFAVLGALLVRCARRA